MVSRKGGFEVESNINYWITFCEKVFSKLGQRVKWWCTINEPTVFTAMGYVRNFPESALSKNQMFRIDDCNARCYRALKKMKGGEQSTLDW